MLANNTVMHQALHIVVLTIYKKRKPKMKYGHPFSKKEIWTVENQDLHISSCRQQRTATKKEGKISAISKLAEE